MHGLLVDAQMAHCLLAPLVVDIMCHSDRKVRQLTENPSSNKGDPAEVKMQTKSMLGGGPKRQVICCRVWQCCMSALARWAGC